MTYDETVEYLFNCAPPFQQVGGAAYKEGLANTMAIDSHLGSPHRKFRTIHVAGTNGKGSSSHTLAAILMEADYKVGLYTSPHLVDFRERIRVNGVPASKEFVVEFVEREKAFFEPLQPSFFELTTAMAFTYFAQENVDVAIIEVGLGGRLDCTNIISPDLCIITNISLDHTQFLGSTHAGIAKEKAGIIKPHTPVIIGEATAETRKVFEEKALQENAPIIFAQESDALHTAAHTPQGIEYDTADYGTFTGELRGDYQVNNTRTVLAALRELQKIGYTFTAGDVANGFSKVCSTTGFRGRWQKIGDTPRIVCDAGHNIGGIKYIVQQLLNEKYTTLRIVFGMVSDKDISTVLSMMPAGATYYFTQAGIKRAMPAGELRDKAAEYGLHGNAYPTVEAALNAAVTDAEESDLIFVGGSCFIVADLLTTIEKEHS